MCPDRLAPRSPLFLLPLLALLACTTEGHLALDRDGSEPRSPAGEASAPAPASGRAPGIHPARIYGSKKGIFQISVAPQISPIEVGKRHAWVIHLETSEGYPIDKAAITVTGGVSEHGRGLPGAPRVSRGSGSGNFLVEGLIFGEQGAWEVSLEITAVGRRDQVTVDFDL